MVGSYQNEWRLQNKSTSIDPNLDKLAPIIDRAFRDDKP
ncbi:hypothetical protein VCRA2120E57_2140001 [Vibrio crassostreae]|nr:hypothetical protein VCRA2120E57_2140001 [Vibrio crassostreae]